MREHSSGFTLIELVVTIAIAAILMALAAPALNTLVQSSRRAAAVNQFVTLLSAVRTEALTRRTRVSVCRSSNATSSTPSCNTSTGVGDGWEDGWVMFVDSVSPAGTINIDGTAPDDIVLRQEGQQPADWTVRGNTPVRNYVSFDALGLAGTLGSIIFCYGGSFAEGRVVDVSKGRVRTLKTNDTDNSLTTCVPST